MSLLFYSLLKLPIQIYLWLTFPDLPVSHLVDDIADGIDDQLRLFGLDIVAGMRMGDVFGVEELCQLPLPLKVSLKYDRTEVLRCVGRQDALSYQGSEVVGLIRRQHNSRHGSQLISSMHLGEAGLEIRSLLHGVLVYDRLVVAIEDYPFGALLRSQSIV